MKTTPTARLVKKEVEEAMSKWREKVDADPATESE